MATDYVFGTTSTLLGWTLKSGTTEIVTSWDYGLDGQGFFNVTVSGFANAISYGTITNYSQSYEASLEADITHPILGTTAGVCVTSVSLTKTAAAKATMSVTSHEHSEEGAGNGSYNWSLEAYINGSGWGSCTPPIGDAIADGSCLSWSLTAAIQHEDQGACNGDHLVGESYDPIIDVTVEVVGTTPLALNAANLLAGWELVSTSKSEKTPGFTSSITVARLHLAKPA